MVEKDWEENYYDIRCCLWGRFFTGQVVKNPEPDDPAKEVK